MFQRAASIALSACHGMIRKAAVLGIAALFAPKDWLLQVRQRKRQMANDALQNP